MVDISNKDKAYLKDVVNDDSIPERIRTKARALLLCSDGNSINSVAKKCSLQYGSLQYTISVLNAKGVKPAIGIERFKSSIKLSTRDKVALREIANSDDWDEKYKKYAKVLLMRDANEYATRIAEELGVASSTVSYWIGMYRSRGLEAFGIDRNSVLHGEVIQSEVTETQDKVTEEVYANTEEVNDSSNDGVVLTFDDMVEREYKSALRYVCDEEKTFYTRLLYIASSESVTSDMLYEMMTKSDDVPKDFCMIKMLNILTRAFICGNRIRVIGVWFNQIPKRSKLPVFLLRWLQSTRYVNKWTLEVVDKYLHNLTFLQESRDANIEVTEYADRLYTYYRLGNLSLLTKKVLACPTVEHRYGLGPA